jgi:hypothetical protein
MKYINILCRQNADSFKFKANGTYNKNCASKGLTVSVYERKFYVGVFPMRSQ